MTSLALLRLVSPSLPVGAYSYSRGLEYAVEAGWVRDADTAGRWIRGVLADAVAPLDGPVLARMLDAWRDGDVDRALRWNGFLAGCRETAELLREDEAMGAALARLLVDLGVDVPRAPLGYTAAFALACARWDVPPADAVAGYLWAAGESQIGAAIKLVPLGQTDGQRIATALIADIPGWAAAALAIDDDDDIGGVSPMQAMASALHETQYTRLFRS